MLTYVHCSGVIKPAAGSVKGVCGCHIYPSLVIRVFFDLAEVLQHDQRCMFLIGAGPSRVPVLSKHGTAPGQPSVPLGKGKGQELSVSEMMQWLDSKLAQAAVSQQSPKPRNPVRHVP